MLHGQDSIVPQLRAAGGIQLTPDQSMIPSSPFGGSGALFSGPMTLPQTPPPNVIFPPAHASSPASFISYTPEDDLASPVSAAEIPRSASATISHETKHPEPLRGPQPRNPNVMSLRSPPATLSTVAFVSRGSSTSSLSSLDSQTAVGRDRPHSPGRFPP